MLADDGHETRPYPTFLPVAASMVNHSPLLVLKPPGSISARMMSSSCCVGGASTSSLLGDEGLEVHLAPARPQPSSREDALQPHLVRLLVEVEERLLGDDPVGAGVRRQAGPLAGAGVPSR